MKKFAIVAVLIILGGCATHAEIETPVVSQVTDPVYEDKTLAYELLYSQPEPGVMSDGDQIPLEPLADAKMSVAAASTLSKLPEYIFEQLPHSVQRVDSGVGDYKLVVEIMANHKKVPAFADFQAAKSLGLNLLTMGLASSDYDIVADFNARYKLYSGETMIYMKDYKVDESVDHERGDFESYNSVNDYAGQLLKKHLIITLNDFFKSATNNI